MPSAGAETDAATEALIAQLMAEDFGEVFNDHIRPIGSHWGDYEDPLTSYERQCLEHPDMEDWHPSTPTITPADDSLTLPEGGWDSSFDDDPNIEPMPFFKSDIVGENDGDGEGHEGEWGSSTDDNALVKSSPPVKCNGVDKEDTSEDEEHEEDGGVSIETPLHQLHDPIDHHKPDITINQASESTQKQSPPSADLGRNSPDSSHLETSRHENQSHLMEKDVLQQLERNKSPDHGTHNLTRSDLFVRSIATNELLCTYMSDPGSENENRTPKNKSKGRQRSNHSPTKIVHNACSKIPSTDSWHNDEIDTSTSKNKGKAHDPGPDSDDEESGDFSDIDDETSLPFLRIPWPGLSTRERAAKDRENAQVVDIYVGEEETVESILRDIREREEIRERGWGEWGDVGEKGKWKSKAVDYW